ncbi:methyl-accepting chemotaxis protein [Shewanella sp. C32]|uniref:Methyl-accepting chemotaxis protein n=1 Tax=Shewanella electrica TaxID=515560 RepID=A0ABT2FL08_9GAMM|nr:methyl-accepting chemotaxis protein [Shewanella electrica]MCH1923805.1 methyl-accepting chemotaxis protein [Shewanella electrica]MCS4557023.1 methyl-accepting chemotaxis protein [Shewanella electrica]
MENISLAVKLAIAFGFMIVLSIVLTVSGWLGLTKVIDSGNKLFQIQTMSQTVASLKATRENYQRTMALEDKQHLSQMVQQLQQSLQTELPKYRSEDARRRIERALVTVNDYQQILNQLASIIDQKVVKTDQVMSMASHINKLQREHVKQLQDQANDEVPWQAIAMLNAADTYMEQLEKLAVTWLVAHADGQQTYRQIEAKAQSMTALWQQASYVDARVNIGQLNQALNELLAGYRQLLQLDEKVASAKDTFIGSAASLRDDVKELKEFQSLSRAQANQQAKIMLASVAGLALVIGFAATLIMKAQIVTPIQETVALAARIAKGDLTHKVTSKRQDELGVLQRAMGEMSQSLKELVSNVSSGIAELSSSATQLSAATVQNRANLGKQHIEIEQVAAAINQMTTTVHDVANNAEQTSVATGTAQQVTQEGTIGVQQAIVSVRELNQVIENTSAVMAQLASQSDNIGSVLSVIKSIAEQTNLLALNAAIEAARAGEQGRGFAVVADEVRQLAQRTQQSTAEIEQMIQQLQQESQNAVKMMEVSQNLASGNSDMASAVGELFEQIAKAVSDVQQMNHQIATAAEEQSVVAEEINRRVAEVNDIAGLSATSSNETAEATERLAALGAQLKVSISGFKVA